MRRALRKLRRLAPARRRAVLEAALWIVAIRTALLVFPFHTVLRVVRRLARPPGRPGLPRPDPDDAVWAVQAAGRRLLRRNPCLTEALAALVVLRRAGRAATLRVGVAKDGDVRLRAHAWVEDEGRVIVGGETAPLDYVTLPALDADLS